MKKFLKLIILFIISNTISAREITPIPHWGKNTIKVYIPSGNNTNTVKNAFQQWQGMSSGKLNFEFVQKLPADIEIEFKEGTSGSTPISYYSLEIDGNNINKAVIYIDLNKAQNYSNNYTNKVMLHEVGHALGMKDMPMKKTSIMHTPVTEEQELLKLDIRNLYSISEWSYADRNF